MQNKILKLNKEMIENYVAVNVNKNPVAVELNNLSLEQIKYILGQYTEFPKNIVSFLKEARDKAREEKLKDIDTELTKNIGEELGTESDGFSHYGILIKSLREELDINVPSIKCNQATKEFVLRMSEIIKNKNKNYVIGAIYACESSAVPELEIILKFAKQLSKISNKEIKEGSLLKKFFEMHLSIWEPGHENRLKTACLNELSDQEDNSFEEGFREVMKTMDNWWNNMFIEVKTQQ